jgi:lincosamide nucleotidyltransferase A/C/D/E
VARAGESGVIIESERLVLSQSYRKDILEPSKNKMKNDKSEMTAVDVIEIVKLLEKNGMTIIIDGGWGVDALLGEQTRNHEDLDVAVLHKDVPLIRSLLEARGYQDIPRDDTCECNFVLGDDQGHLFDLHSCTFDAVGNNVFGVEYPKDSWEGTGTINGYPVRCITPEWMVKFHTGYELDENDYHDVKLLCQRYALEIPSEYATFDKKDGQS